MHLKCAFGRSSGISLIEVLCATAVLSMVVTVTLVRSSLHSEADRARCINNLKETGLAFRQFANDNGDRFPMAVPELFGGARGAAARGEISRIYQTLSEYSLKPEYAVCPADDRTASVSVAVISSGQLSYFLNLDAQREDPASWLRGDRDLTAEENDRSDKRLLRGIQNIDSTSTTFRWSGQLHRNSGNIAFADGAVQAFQPPALAKLPRSAIRRTERLLFPQ